MHSKTVTEKVIITMIIVILIIISSINSFAAGTGTSGIQPRQITGDGQDLDIELGFIDDVTTLVSTAGTFIAVGVLMVIGIRYMMGSLEERASYKKSMMPYVIGCFILFGASYIAPQFKDLFAFTVAEGKDATTEIGNKILGLIQVTGTLISVGALMIMGIRYMMGSLEERASYKKSMIPYIVGAVLLFAAVNITSIIYNAVPKGSSTGTSSTSEKGTIIRVTQ